jgi:GntR family transcriptional repressor for pyruvate dehydrogenase complex
LQPVERISLLDQVVAKLKDHITGGELQIGDRMPTEKDVCESLQVGRSTVREAFRVLQTLGYIKTHPGRGAVVVRVSGDDPATVLNWFGEHDFELSDCFEVRLAIEPLAVKLAAKRARTEQIEDLVSLLTAFDEAVRSGDQVKLAMADEAFHGGIVEAAGNLLLSSISQNIAQALFEYRCRVFSVEGYAANALEPHRRILAAIRDGDADRGSDEMVRHLEISLEDIKQLMGRDFRKPMVSLREGRASGREARR